MRPSEQLRRPATAHIDSRPRRRVKGSVSPSPKPRTAPFEPARRRSETKNRTERLQVGLLRIFPGDAGSLAAGACLTPQDSDTLRALPRLYLVYPCPRLVLDAIVTVLGGGQVEDLPKRTVFASTASKHMADRPNMTYLNGTPCATQADRHARCGHTNSG